MSFYVSLAVRVFLVAALSACFERGSKESAKVESEKGAESGSAPVGKISRPVPLGKALRSSELSGVPDKSASITIAISSEPIHLNPLLAGDRVAVDIALGDIYEALLSIPKPGAPVELGLANRYLRSEDGKRWQFWLRTGVHFHDSSTLSAEDVKKSVALAQGAPGPLRAEFDDLLTISEEPDKSLVFRFAEDRVGRAQAIASLPIVSSASFRGVKPESMSKAKASSDPNGTGPLRFVSHRDGRIELARNDGYWGPPSKAASVHYRVIADRQRLMAEFRAGKVDMVRGLSVDQALRDSHKVPTLALFRESMPAYTAAVFNCEGRLLSDELRRALARSFDRRTIIEQLFEGYARPAVGPYPVDSPKNDNHIPAQLFVLADVRNDLDRLWPKGEDPLRVLVPQGSRTMQRLADIWAEDLRGVVGVKIVSMPFAQLLESVRTGDFDITFLSFTTGEDVDLFSLFHSSHIGSGNIARLVDSKLDALLESLRSSNSEEGLLSLYREIHPQLRNLAPFAFLTTDLRLGLVRDAADNAVGGVGDGVSHWGARYLWRRK